MRSKLTYVLTGLVAAIVAFLLMRGGDQGPPIWQNGGRLVIENQSKLEWRDVSVTVNAYYRGVAPRVAAGARLEAPLAQFVPGLGRRLHWSRGAVMRVEVRATDAAGKPVALDWDEQTGSPLVREGR